MLEIRQETRAGQPAAVRVQMDPAAPLGVDPWGYTTAGDGELPRRFEVWFGGDVAHVAAFEVRDGRPVCVAAGAQATTGRVQTADLRAVRIQDMLDHALRVLSQPAGLPGAWAIAHPWAAEEPEFRRARTEVAKAASRRVSDDQLREVARVYEANIDGAPTQTVADTFGISLRTASNWVKRATDSGFIAQRQRKAD